MTRLSIERRIEELNNFRRSVQYLPPIGVLGEGSIRQLLWHIERELDHLGNMLKRACAE